MSTQATSTSGQLQTDTDIHNIMFALKLRANISIKKEIKSKIFVHATKVL